MTLVDESKAPLWDGGVERPLAKENAAHRALSFARWRTGGEGSVPPSVGDDALTVTSSAYENILDFVHLHVFNQIVHLFRLFGFYLLTLDYLKGYRNSFSRESMLKYRTIFLP